MNYMKSDVSWNFDAKYSTEIVNGKVRKLSSVIYLRVHLCGTYG